VLFWHDSADGYRRKARHRSWEEREPLEPCDCPLRGSHYVGDYDIKHIGLDPESVLETHRQWEENRPVQLKRFGAKSVTNLGRVAERLTEDLSEAGLLGDPML